MTAQVLDDLIQEIQRLKQIEIQYLHALDCVNRVFQNSDSILPDFALCGDDKFGLVVTLARQYKDLRVQYFGRNWSVSRYLPVGI